MSVKEEDGEAEQGSGPSASGGESQIHPRAKKEKGEDL